LNYVYDTYDHNANDLENKACKKKSALRNLINEIKSGGNGDSGLMNIKDTKTSNLNFKYDKTSKGHDNSTEGRKKVIPSQLNKSNNIMNTSTPEYITNLKLYNPKSSENLQIKCKDTNNFLDLKTEVNSLQNQINNVEKKLGKTLFLFNYFSKIL